MLKNAQYYGYAIPAFNIFDFESIYWVLIAAEIEKMPIILQYVPKFESYIPQETVISIVDSLSARIGVPISLHLDHAHHFEEVKNNTKFFNSIMFDGGNLEFEENTSMTKRVVEYCHKRGITVEAALGQIVSTVDNNTDTIKYTNPALVPEYVTATNCDSLAVSVGTAHGKYINKPIIDIPRIEQISKTTSVPLVLHGGSDLDPDILSRCIYSGITKINIFTDYNESLYENVFQQMNIKRKGYFLGCLRRSQTDVISFLRDKIKLFNPRGVNIYNTMS